jgi:hypothetical protein
MGNGRTDAQCLHRWSKVVNPGLVKVPWTQKEDELVKRMVLANSVGEVKWSVIAAELPGRVGKQV